MKIILCTFLLCITVSVFGQSVELNGTLGKSIEFPAAVKKGGSLMYGTLTLGEVASGRFRTSRNGRFNGRVQWNSSTGFFSLSGLKMEDIGEYKVQNTDQNINTVFQLNVSTVSVFGKPQELHGVKNQSVKFTAAVKKKGSLMYGTLPIGDMTNGRFWTPQDEKYRDRVQWDSSTGFFSLSGLKMEDSGEYKVHNADQNIDTVFQLNVYIPVSKPHVSITHNEYPCTIECTAERGTEATLSWYREGQKKPYGSYPVRSAPDLHLPQTVHKGGIYTCEANNSVSNEKASITVEAHCTDYSSTIVASVIAAVVVVLIAVVFAVLYWRNRSKHPTKDDIIRKVEGSVDNLIYLTETQKIITSSQQTEVPLKQATREVGEP